MRISKWLPRRLWQQIFLILLGLAIIPLLISGALLIHTSQQALEKTVNRDLRQIALHATGEVLKEYEGAYRALEATASILGTLHADAWRQETAIVQLSLKYPSLRYICSLDLQGHPIACSDLDSVHKKVNEDLLSCAKNQDHCASNVHIASDYVPVMDLAVPVFRYGKVEEVLIAEYDLREIWNVVDKIQFGPESRAILIDQSGHILAHPDKKEVLKNSTFNHIQVLHDLDQEKNSSRTILDAQGQKWIIAYSPISSLHWGLIVAQPYQEAFAFVRLMHYHSWILVVLSVLAAGLIGFIIAQWMCRPMHEVIEATRRLAKGDLTVSLPVSRRDEVGRLKFAFNHMTSQLKKAHEVERLSIVGKSAASIAHELKNSLVLVKSFVQLIPHRHKDRAFVEEATETITRELEGWNTMLRNIMDFAKEQMPLHLESININVFIEEVTLLTKLKAEEQQVAFHIQTKEVLPLIRADEARLKQVLVNLIANAFEATPQGGEIYIRTFAKGHAHHATVGFEVSNSGEGISKESLSKVFEPFFTTKDTGLGLGLAISRDIVHRHGGRLEAESEQGQGAVFRAIFPVYSNETQIKGDYDIRENRRHR